MPVILTLAGQAAFAAAAAPGGDPVAFSKLVVGDGGGTQITPVETATNLTNQVYEIGVQSVAVDNQNPNLLIIVATVPNEAGPFTIREVGLEASNGQLLAIADYPETVKSVAAQGVPTSIEVTIGLIVSETANVTVELTDPLTVSTDRRIDTDDGLGGGGDFSQDRTFKLAFGSLDAITGSNVDNATDKFAIFDHSAGKHKNLSPEEAAKALGVQTKIDAAIGGLPPDQVLGLSTPAETIEGTNTTKATHAAGVKAAIDNALGNFDPNGSFAFDPTDAGLDAVQISNAQYAASGNRFAFLVGSGEGAFIVRNHAAGCDVMQVQGSVIVSTLNSGYTVLEVMDDGTILTSQGGNYHLSHINENRLINHIMSTSQGNLPGTLVAGRGNRIYSIAGDGSSNWAVAHHTYQHQLEHQNPIFLPTNIEDRFNGKNSSSYSLMGAYVLPETGALCLMLKQQWAHPYAAHLYIFPDEDTANTPLEFDLTADGANSLLGIRGSTLYIGVSGTLNRDIAAYIFDGTNLTKQWERGLGLNALNRGQYLIAGETLLGFSSTDTNISVLQLEGEGNPQRLDNDDIQVIPQGENPYPPNIVSDGDTVFVVPSGWSGGNQSRVSAWSKLAKGAIQR